MRSPHRSLPVATGLAAALVLLAASSQAHSQTDRRGAQYHSALATSDGVRATLYRYVPPAGP